ncbi:uncharacterized protein LOC123559654 isoform X2 [Mercenaria mercenaria]|uniref:uncharacterized protein LOC123559654 isoform X2 n=1 Tax=Mercenaria mercenaria TaxID=6596 RepID=UPI00234EF42C|nr:uncharacterized protein LOC123559654 isoform X2 [Mercenaria mercenaria]
MEGSAGEDLPDGWEERYDTTHGRIFHVHPERRIAQLEDPRIQGSQTKQYGKDWINIIDYNAPLEDFLWFHGNLSRREAKRLLKHKPNGTFLIRQSQSCPDWFVIAVRCTTYRHEVFETCIICRHGNFSLLDSDVSFNSLPQFVEHYTKNPLYSYGKLTAALDKFEKITDEEDIIPEELENDPYTRALYEKAIVEGREKDNTIRVMVIGCYGQGKTSLVRRLLKQSLEGVETTNGIDIHRCAIINDKEWVKQGSEDLDKEIIQRLVKTIKYDTDHAETPVISHQRNVGNKDEASTDLYDHIGAAKDSFSASNEKTTLNIMGLTIIDKSDGYSAKKEQRNNRRDTPPVQYTYMNRPTIDDQTLKEFRTELKRIESLEDERINRSATLNIWDFGGQFVYYATHQIFHSKQAVYILVFNLSVGLDSIVKDGEFPLHKKTMRDYLKFWVSSVNSFVGSVDGCKPPIILVGTHTDQLQEDVNVDDYFEEVRKIFDGTSCIYHIQSEHFAVSNKDVQEKVIDQLCMSITHLGQIQLQRCVPAKWLLLEKALKMNKTKKIVSLEEVFEIDSKTDSPIQTNSRQETIEQIKLFLSYHHARGTFCYFDESKLSEYVVLDQQFLIDAFRCIITSGQFCKVRPKMRSLWSDLCDKAVLRPELLEEVWTQNDANDFISFKELLTEYMQKHRIISEVVAHDPYSECSFEPLGYYIVPSLLKVSDDGVIIETFCNGKQLSGVSFGYALENDSMAPVLFQTTLSALIGRWPLISFNEKHILYDNLVACELSRDHAGVLMLKQNRIELLVVNLCPPDGVKSEVCDMFRRYVEVVIDTDMCKCRGTIEDRRLIKHLTVRCFHEDHCSKGSNGIYVIDDLQPHTEERFPCPDKGNHCLKFENILQEWFLHEVDSEHVPCRKLTNKEYSKLSMAIGRNWQQLGLELGLDHIAIEHIQMNKETVDMQIYTMLQLWDKKEADRATLDALVHAIRECSRRHVSINWDILKNVINGF